MSYISFPLFVIKMKSSPKSWSVDTIFKISAIIFIINNVINLLVIILRIGSTIILSFFFFYYTGGSGVRDFETFFVFPMKSIILKSLRTNGGLDCILEINKTIKVFATHFRHLWNQSCTQKSWKRSKNMSYFSFSSITGYSVNIKTTSGVFRNFK